MHVKPVLVDCNFVVDSTNGNGLGIRNLKGPCVQNAFMHTTSTPGAGNPNPSSPNTPVINPNPASGTIVIQMQDTYNRSFSGFNAIVSPASGTAVKVDNSALTAGAAYILTALDPAFTQAQWIALCLPAGVTPAIGASFVASTVGAGGNTSSARVMTAATAGSGVMSIETVGDPNLSISVNPTVSQGFGSQFILQCRNSSGAVAAPADGSVISIAFYLSDSSVQVQGE